MSDQSKFVYSAFRSVYWIGLLAAIFLAFTQPWTGLLPPLFDEKWTFTLLILSVSHVFLLAGMGFLLKWDSRRTYYVHAGEQVQTAGYLHTLIGFGAALLVFDPGGVEGPGQLNLTEVLYPIGSALLTSILGWFFGGEIVGRDARDEPETAARDQLLDLVDHIESFMERAHDRHQAYVDALDSIVETQNTLRERQQSVLSDTTEIAKTVNSTLEELDDTAARIDDHLTSVASSLQEGFNAEQLQQSLRSVHEEAEALDKGLGETSDHVSALSQHLSESRDSAKKTLENLEQFASDAPEVHDRYTSQLQEARDQIRETQDTLREHQQSVLEDTTEMGESVNSTLEELDDTTVQIDNHLTSIASALREGLNAEQLQESLHSVHEEAEALNEGLGETSDHVSAISRHLRKSRESAKKTLGNLEQFASDAPEVHDRYTSQLQKARDEIRQVVEVVEGVLEKAREDIDILEQTPEVLAPVREATQGITEMLGDVETSVREVEAAAQSVERSIGGVNDREDRVKEALEETEATAQRMTTALQQTRTIINDMIEEHYYEERDPA